MTIQYDWPVLTRLCKFMTWQERILKYPMYAAWTSYECPDEIFADWLAEKGFPEADVMRKWGDQDFQYPNTDWINILSKLYTFLENL